MQNWRIEVQKKIFLMVLAARLLGIKGEGGERKRESKKGKGV